MQFSGELDRRGPFESPNSLDAGRHEFQQREHLPRITPEAFQSDGSSFASREFNRDWDAAKTEGDLTAVFACSDPKKIYNPKNAIGFRSMGAVVPEELYGPANVLSREFGTRQAVVMAHHDGLHVAAGEAPPGCGARAAKAALRAQTHEPLQEGAQRFVHERVVHEDPLITAYFSTIDIAERARLPAFGVTEDHRSGLLVPLVVALPTQHGIEIRSKISANKLLQGQYEEAEIYANGVPELEHTRIPDEFLPFLKRHELYIEEMHRRHPDFAAIQEVSNPDIVLITSVLRPSRGRLPETSGKETNRVFAITVARDPNKGSADVDEQSMKDAGDELAYPLTEGLDSQGNSSKPFSKFHNQGTVIVEMRDIDSSRRVTIDLLRRPFMNVWAQNEGNKIILAETRGGIVERAEYFDLGEYFSRNHPIPKESLS